MDVHGRGRRNARFQRGQSLVEFILSATVLFLILVGTLDLGRAFYFAVTLHTATREGARQGTWFDDGSGTNPFLCDYNGSFDPALGVSTANPYCIKQVVDAVLEKAGLPDSTLENPGGPCPQGIGNTVSNPPYVNSAYTGGVDQPLLYICYANDPGVDYRSSPPADNSLKGQDLNVVLLMNFGLVAGFPGLPGTIQMASNTHMSVGGY